MKSLGPSMPFMVDDFLGGTTHMTASEIGMYVLLLCDQWQHGFVSVIPAHLLRVSRARTRSQLRNVLKKFYIDSDGNYRNAKMELIRAERMDYILRQAEKGRLSALHRGSTVVQPEGVPEGQPEGNRKTPLPSASASPLDITHSSNGGFTLEDCLAAGGRLCMPRPDIEAFFNHYDRYDWLGSQGRRITRLHSALAIWKANASNFKKADEPEIRRCRV
jgi:hypothetical protein